MVQKLHDVIVSTQLPEEPETALSAASGPPQPEPLPKVNSAEVFGLMEIVRDLGGKCDVFQLDLTARRERRARPCRRR